MQYTVLLSNGAEIEVEANSAESAEREAIEQGEQVVSAELNLEGVDSTVLNTLTDSEEIVAVAKRLAVYWVPGATTVNSEIVIGMLSQVLADKNTGE